MTSLRLITLVACIVVSSTSGSPAGSGGSTSGGSGGAGGSGAGGSPSGSGTWTLGGPSGPTTSGSSSRAEGGSTGSTNESESSPYGAEGGLSGSDQITGRYLYSRIPVTELLRYRYRGGNIGGSHWDLFGRAIQGGRRFGSLYDFYRPYGPTEYGGIISQSGYSGGYRTSGLFSGQGSQTSHYNFEPHSPLLHRGGLPQRSIYEAYSGQNGLTGGHSYYRVPFGGLYRFRGVGFLARPLIQGMFHQSYDPFNGFGSFGSHNNQYLHMPQYLR